MVKISCGAPDQQTVAFSRPRSAFAVFGLCFALLAAPASASGLGVNGTYMLNKRDLTTQFQVKLLTGSAITGRFEQVSGKMALFERQPERSRIEVVVDLSSVVTNNQRVTDFLKSPAMFDVETNATAVFTSTRVRKINDRQAEVDGVLQLKGQTRPTSLSVSLQDGSTAQKINFRADGGFFRSLFGMAVGQPLYGDRVTLSIQGTGHRS
ncbi:polyisoprenoid-binding protein YceI [Roseibium hamelinense]|uniref:Polyisoprenoid-binding protein YceI n=1 Tax=Roseibium hamelinense TaxID=150831 RepID=A0A562T9Y8_9HYPH|nr:YceI family protein [Roseibium hamelinense]MTI45140.1 polyisoprenoid-binding protein [Roseibium hamelinense]TWI90501.1 polyisoprenoid-binding protein YceI [Roseibium hamelinense]